MLPTIGLTLPLELSIYLFLVATMFSMGLGLTVHEIAAPLRHRRLIGIALFINIILVPLAGVAVVRIIPMEIGVAAGLLIIACAPGSTIGPKLAEFSKGNVSLAISIMFFLSVLAIFTTPLTLTLILPGAVTEQIDFISVMTTLVILIFLPMAAGMTITSRCRACANKIQRPVFIFSNLTIVIFGIIFIWVQVTGEVRFIDSFSSVGIAATVAVFILVAFSMVIGYLLGGPEKHHRQVIATSSANRNLGVSLLVGASALAGYGEAFLIIIVYAIVQTLISGLIAVKWGQKVRKEIKKGEISANEPGTRHS
jgi:BASS family bile acid:Na+ symporter